MNKKQIREKLSELKQAENALNKEGSRLNFIIKDAERKKKKVAKQVSANMRYRNRLINKLATAE